ncbi:hypothetical protein [Nocardia sp. NPDC057227]|uniref:hypothetical protein n=1 Tax=Nocardia sp. NPDC057227 TaxID=3346056 RepID=UPI003636B402
MPLSFDLTGMQALDDSTWGDPVTRDVVAVHYFDIAPELPAGLDDAETLRRRLAEHHAASGCLIEALVIWVDSLPALLRVEKVPMPFAPGKLAYSASILVPRARCSAVLQIICPEVGDPIAREVVVTQQAETRNRRRGHPYAPGLQGRLPFTSADDVRWDESFPDHPLSRARRWVVRTVPTVEVDPEFAALEPYPG